VGRAGIIDESGLVEIESHDADAAERDARAALKLVPNWHYVRDILLPQILAARKARAGN